MNDEPKQDQLLSDHTYDGIQEYDNPLPGWWTWLFSLSIAFSVVYLVVLAVSGGQMTAVGAYDTAVLDQLKNSGGPLKGDTATLVRLMKDDESRKTGSAIFQANCVACHNRDGSGLLGPNLTDDYYLNVTKLEDIPDVVTKGRKNGAMPAWANRLSPNEIVEVSAFVASLRGRNLPSARPHEGVVIPPWPQN